MDFSLSSFRGSRADARGLQVSTTHPDANSWPALSEESWHSPQTYFHYTSSVNLDQMWFRIQRLTVSISSYTHLAPLNIFRALEPSNHFMAYADRAFAAFHVWRGPVVGDQYQTTNQLHWMTGFMLPHTSHRLKNNCVSSHSNIYYQGAISRSTSFFPQLHFMNSNIADCQVMVRAVISH